MSSKTNFLSFTTLILFPILFNKLREPQWVVADLLSRWTGGEYKSTPHRVVNSSTKERLSLVLAFDPNPETMIDPKEVHGKSFNSEEDPISCGDYLIWRFGKAFSYRN